MNPLIAKVQGNGRQTPLPEFNVGDTVKVHQKIREGEKERIQIFQGVVISRTGGTQHTATFTVRKVSFGIGVERVYPLNSPNVINVELLREGKVRRAKLNYLKSLSGKSAKIKEKRKS